jgi:hypothetical protein
LPLPGPPSTATCPAPRCLLHRLERSPQLDHPHRGVLLV